MTREEIERCWKDPRNSRWGLYYCKEDPRVVVPKRFKWMGWTMNFAHPWAIPVMLFLIAILLVPVLIAAKYQAEPVVVLGVLAGAIAFVSAICAWLSARTGGENE